jgi:hypothetical protein
MANTFDWYFGNELMIVIRSVGVSNLAPTSKFLFARSGLRTVCAMGEQNVSTSSHSRLALLAPLLINTRTRRYKQAREGGGSQVDRGFFLVRSLTGGPRGRGSCPRQ